MPKPPRPNRRAEFVKIIHELSGRFSPMDVFRDYVEAAHLALRQWPGNLAGKTDAALEQQYLSICKKHGDDNFRRFAELLGLTEMALAETEADFLGPIFMEVRGSAWAGQFFSPPEICLLIARMSLTPDILAAKKEIVTALEPACGAGGMILALAQTLRQEKFDGTNRLMVTAIDIDALCAQMCFVQTTLLAIPIQVVIGNTLSAETLSNPSGFNNAYWRTVAIRQGASTSVPDHIIKEAAD